MHAHIKCLDSSYSSKLRLLEHAGVKCSACKVLKHIMLSELKLRVFRLRVLEHSTIGHSVALDFDPLWLGHLLFSA